MVEVAAQNDYDPNGNLTRSEKGGQVDSEVLEYEYDALNRLVHYTDASGTRTNYTYNGQNQRTRKWNEGTTTRYYWDRGYISNERGSNSWIAANYVGATGIFARETAENAAAVTYMMKNGHGDVTALVSGGAVTKTYDYDAYGVEKNPDSADTNPFRYCAEYFDQETQNIYLRNRYYNPSNGRFLTEDPAQDGLNWYVYANNNPLTYTDPTGLIPWEDASNIIRNNAQGIKNAGSYYGVNPAIIAACIYTELTQNVNWVDDLTDVSGYFLDTSIGIGQVKVSTAKMLEDSGYIAKTTFKRTEVMLWDSASVWDAPGIGEVIADNREQAIAFRLNSESENVNYVAAYLKYFQDRWKEAYPEIDGRTAILATLFNQGEKRPPHSSPER